MMCPTRKPHHTINASMAVSTVRVLAYCSASGVRQKNHYGNNIAMPTTTKCSFISNAPITAR